ncbi:hypothetical protein GF359_08160 [candidate division WOR-3 bacterium]|uniref:Tetratricopeptide repeat protein n=1 Tax=candidate division WOR-3 bacterium TaxID=2052148 RepID=A0A9D5QD22_UNCW3|nr:hypothetical protein [candidate division WOR-3 bacterium]MBD3365174.1 hypothetical protein [candidate division WOR-3 bacterium]
MRQEALDLEGKVELARMLLQLGFKTEALAELLTAAETYVERGNNEAAIELYEKVLETDPENKVAKNKLYKIKPRSTQDIDGVISKMGIGTEEKEGEEAPVETEAETAVKEEKPEAAEAPPEEPETVEVDRVEKELLRDLEAKPEVNLSAIGIEEFLASIGPLLKNTPEELAQRRILTDFFRKEGLWIEAFFEARAEYRTQPTVDKLYKLLSLINQSGDQDILVTFLLTESFAKRDPEVEQEILSSLIATFEGMGKIKEAEKIKQRLKKKKGVELSDKRKDLQALKAELEGRQGTSAEESKD